MTKQPLVAEALWAGVAVAAFVILRVGGTGKMADSPNPDEFGLGLLAKPNHREAREWLQASPGRNTLGELQTTEESIAVVQEAYGAGAAAVTAVKIDADGFRLLCVTRIGDGILAAPDQAIGWPWCAPYIPSSARRPDETASRLRPAPPPAADRRRRR